MRRLLEELEELREENRNLRNKNAEIMQQKANVEKEFLEYIIQTNQYLAIAMKKLERLEETINRVIS